MVVAWAFCLSGTSFAQKVPDSFWGSGNLPEINRGGSLTTEQIQFLLLWLGFYYNEVDGNLSDETRDAITRFQASLGARESGRLTREQEDLLRNRGLRAQENAAFEDVRDAWTGIKVPLPLGYLTDPEVIPESKFNIYYFPLRRLGQNDLCLLLGLKKALGQNLGPANILFERLLGQRLRRPFDVHKGALRGRTNGCPTQDRICIIVAVTFQHSAEHSANHRPSDHILRRHGKINGCGLTAKSRLRLRHLGFRQAVLNRLRASGKKRQGKSNTNSR